MISQQVFVTWLPAPVRHHCGHSSQTDPDRLRRAREVEVTDRGQAWELNGASAVSHAQITLIANQILVGAVRLPAAMMIVDED